jgi:hypothetical protein
VSLHCPVDGRQMPGTATICGACSAELGRALNTVATWLAAELDVTLSRQHTRDGTGTGEVEDDRAPAVLHIGPLGYDPRASQAGTDLHNALCGWVRDLQDHRPEDDWPHNTAASMAAWLSARLSRLASHPAAQELHGEILAAVRAAERVVDRAADRWYAGICAAPLRDGERCQRDLYAKPKAAQVVCPACSHEWDVKQRRDWLLGLAEDVLASATEIARAVTRLGRPVTPEAVRGYAARGRILAHSERLVGKRVIPLYRVGDVLDVIAQIAGKDGSMAS